MYSFLSVKMLQIYYFVSNDRWCKKVQDLYKLFHSWKKGEYSGVLKAFVDLDFEGLKVIGLQKEVSRK